MRLKHAADQARELMDRHGLDEWALRFNGARKKLGECRPLQKLILISRVHALNGAPGQVTDTILHEIAHALAGPNAGHGPAWKPSPGAWRNTESCAPKATRRAMLGKPPGRSSERRRGHRHRVETSEPDHRSHEPKRAKVKCADVMWSVPYARLRSIRPTSPGS